MLATAAGFAVVALQMGSSVFEAATTPRWGYLAGAFAAWIVIQPLRALLWKLTIRMPVEFKASDITQLRAMRDGLRDLFAKLTFSMEMRATE